MPVYILAWYSDSECILGLFFMSFILITKNESGDDACKSLSQSEDKETNLAEGKYTCLSECLEIFYF